MVKESIESNRKPLDINIGHLSQKIDDILTRAIYDGVSMSLKEGLEFESRLFGECIDTADMKIGLDNFRNNGPRAKADFIHK